MAIYRKNADGTEKRDGGNEQNASKLGRGLDSLSRDNAPAEKKPLVVRRGVYEEKRPIVKTRPPITERAGVGGQVLIRADQLPSQPIRSAKSARKGTTVLVRAERPDPPKRFRLKEPNVDKKSRSDILPGAPIVINPRKKK